MSALALRPERSSPACVRIGGWLAHLGTLAVARTAFEGIDGVPGRGLPVADGWAAQADAVATLLLDRARGDAIGAAARARGEARYGWVDRLAPLDRIVGQR